MAQDCLDTGSTRTPHQHKWHSRTRQTRYKVTSNRNRARPESNQGGSASSEPPVPDSAENAKNSRIMRPLRVGCRWPVVAGSVFERVRNCPGLLAVSPTTLRDLPKSRTKDVGATFANPFCRFMAVS